MHQVNVSQLRPLDHGLSCSLFWSKIVKINEVLEMSDIKAK